MKACESCAFLHLMYTKGILFGQSCVQKVGPQGGAFSYRTLYTDVKPRLR